MITKEQLFSIFSDGTNDFVYPEGFHEPGQLVTISMRSLAGVPLEDVKLRIFPDGEERLLKTTLERRGKFNFWSAETRLTCLPFCYRFRIQTSDRVYWLNSSGLHACMPPDEEDFKLVPGFRPPEWAQESVFYQIFPDRFRCGRPEFGRADRRKYPDTAPPVIRNWEENYEGDRSSREFFCGDLWGIREMIPHLEMLGVNALYLTPIFEAPSNHKYDTTDYCKVDAHLGGNEGLSALSAALKSHEMRYVLDGVFNHTGKHHPWFLDAVKNPESAYRSWYTFEEYPENYVGWMNHKSLPKLDYSSKELSDLMFRNPDSIALRWLDNPYCASGWRLDAPNMLGCNGVDERNLEIWREFRKKIKSIYEDSFIFGECFFEGSKWLQGDAFDSIMNYKGFTIPIIQWLSKKDLHLFPAEIHASEAASWMNSVMARIPYSIRNLQYNALSTHDIPRFIDRVEMNEQLYKLALVFQMAFPGIPSIYYGEEIALSGGNTSSNRIPMKWSDVTHKRELLEFVSCLAGLRRSSALLKNGSFRFVSATDDILAFVRFLENDVLIVAGNRSPKPGLIDIPVEWLGFSEGQRFSSIFSIGSVHFVEDGKIKLFLSAYEGIWLSGKLDQN
ncbi:MAG: alpha-glucosidase C-terminal domain-containing protein [Candidatus Riflebacteria bacterium]|nr:alpha-glucosidase C-terminal domain-containing protein [Candidatus Riflebacteria bacterium]